MDKIIAILLLVQACSALPNYPTSPSSNGYEPKTQCRQVEEVVFQEKCEDYTDKICFTTFEEHCNDVRDQTCRATVSTSQTRKCFNVTETRCTLKEDVSFEVIDTISYVQRCSKDTERVCDTIAEIDFSTSSREQCINVPSLVCNTEERTVFEKTCKTETRFDCEGNAGPTQQSSTSYGSSVSVVGSGSGLSSGHGSDYRSSQSGYSSSDDQFGGSIGGGSQSYGSEQAVARDVQCERRQDRNCHTTPRQVGTTSCQKREERVCERISERIPQLGDRQVCRNEEKRICRLEERTQPKQVKKYVYTKVCRPMTKRVCENVDTRTLVPSCVPTTRKECHSSPSERCEDIPKRNCFQVPTTVLKEKCEVVEGYGGQTSSPVDHGQHAHTASYQ